eukprot:m.263686 g.263686  ORF g.263686 m.263686 type:complete len:56 (-) comp26712_c0_seq1:181-348(-)
MSHNKVVCAFAMRGSCCGSVEHQISTGIAVECPKIVSTHCHVLQSNQLPKDGLEF